MKEKKESKTNSYIQSEALFGFKIIFLIIKLPFLLLAAPFSKTARLKIKEPIREVKKFLLETKITTTLIIINILAYIGEFFLTKETLENIIYLKLTVTNQIIIDKFICTIFTWFMHANLSHLLGNMLVLLIFGRVVEKYIKKKYLQIYFSSALIGSLISIFFTQYGIGASAAISGLVITGILIRPFYLTFLTILPLPIFIVGWISIYSDLNGVFNQVSNGIGYLAHVGGYVGALLISLLFITTSKEKHEIRKGLIINIILLLVFILIKVIK
ncbi:rhomboid family intramembrane serine protease [Candidatus Woesearchaeota archaeon]|nr:rhomboid family intramembrane serine protease [Candidatus Woesearchaeota archaeon]